MDDAEERLKDNLDGLDWLVPQLEGRPAGPRPRPRTPVPPPPAARRRKQPRPLPPAAALSPAATPYDPALVAALIQDARTHGDPLKGAEVFAAPKFACLSCHRVGDQGAMIGPDLSTIGNLFETRRNRRVDPLAPPAGQGRLRGVHGRHERRQDSPGLQAGRDAAARSCSASRPRRPLPGRPHGHRGDPPGWDADARRADGRDVAGRAPGSGPVPVRSGPNRQRRGRGTAPACPHHGRVCRRPGSASPRAVAELAAPGQSRPHL